jgi:hypothetical protein
MQAYRLYTTITDPQQITLTDLPFTAGQAVEILILSKDASSHEPPTNLGVQAQSLFRLTQALPQVQTITDQDIEAEVAAYRQEVCES